MNNEKVKKVFTKMLKQNGKGKGASFYTDYDNAKALLKLLCGIPDAEIESVVLVDTLYDNYCDLFVVSYTEDNHVFVEKAINTNGGIARGDSEYEKIYLDADYIKEDEIKNYDINAKPSAKLI